MVCPASLLRNWKREFDKWLGDLRISVLVVEGGTASLSEFDLGHRYNVLLVGYEKLRAAMTSVPADLVICDEGKHGELHQDRGGISASHSPHV